MTREQAAKIKSKFITEKQKALMKSTSAIEKVLLNKIFDQLFVMLGDGKTIVSDTGAELKISEVINKVFADFKKNENLKLINEIGDNMIAIATLNQNYFTTIAKNAKQLKKIYKEVDTNMKSRIGIDKNNQLASGGFLDSLLGDTSLKNAILAETRAAFGNKNVTTQTYLNKIREVIVGNEQHMGAISSQYRGFVHDTYSQFNNEYADKVATRLELNAAVYEGGLINTSREFCIKKNGKVFTRAEIAAWKDDPDLLMTKDEKKAGAPIDYVPHRDRGRWECRHDLNWIPDDEAIRMRPDLKGVLGTPDAVEPKEKPKKKEKKTTTETKTEQPIEIPQQDIPTPVPPSNKNTYKYIPDYEKAEQETERIFNKMNSIEKRPVTEYTGDTYEKINNHLRTGAEISSETEALIDNLKATLKKIPIRYEGETYRGIKFDDAKEMKKFIKENLSSDVFVDKGFLSTSAEQRVAKGFMRQENSILLTVLGKNGVPVKSVSNIPKEEEVLFISKTRFRLVSSIVTDKERNLMHITIQELQ